MKTNKVTKLHYEAATGYRDGLFWCSYRQKVVTTIHQRTQYHTSASQAGNIFLLKRPFKIGWIAHQCGWFNNTKLKAIFLNQMCVLHFWFVFFFGGWGVGWGYTMQDLLSIILIIIRVFYLPKFISFNHIIQ